jgi:hypothetical protein
VARPKGPPTRLIALDDPLTVVARRQNTVKQGLAVPPGHGEGISLYLGRTEDLVVWRGQDGLATQGLEALATFHYFSSVAGSRLAASTSLKYRTVPTFNSSVASSSQTMMPLGCICRALTVHM